MATALGVAHWSLHRWIKASKRDTRFHPVRIVTPLPAAPAPGLVIELSTVGARVEGSRCRRALVHWVAAGVLEAVKGFRRLKGHKAMPQLVTALRARDQQLGIAKVVENVA